MNCFIFKIYDDDKYTDNLSFDKSIDWNNYDEEFAQNDTAFVFLINERKFICALNIDEVRKRKKDCRVHKKWDIDEKQSDEIIEKHSDYINSLQRHSVFKLEDKNLVKCLLDTIN